MNVQIAGETIRVTDLRELNGSMANTFRDKVTAALTPEQTCVEVDLSQATAVDSCGLAALVFLQRTGNRIRLLNPPPPIRQLLQLTRMNHTFEIVQN